MAWCQISLHFGKYDIAGEVDPEADADWSYSYRFRTTTKVWRVKPFEEALEGFRTMVNRKAEVPREVVQDEA